MFAFGTVDEVDVLNCPARLLSLSGDSVLEVDEEFGAVGDN